MSYTELYITTITWNISNKQATPQAIEEILKATRINKPAGAEELVIVLSQEEGGNPGKLASQLGKDGQTMGHYFGTQTKPGELGNVSAYCYSPSNMLCRIAWDAYIDKTELIKQNKGGVVVDIDFTTREKLQIPIQFASVHLESKVHQQRLTETIELTDRFYSKKLTLDFEELSKVAKPVQIFGGDLNLRYEYSANQALYDPSTQTLLPFFGLNNQTLDKTMLSVQGQHIPCDDHKHYTTYNKDNSKAEYTVDEKRNEVLKAGHLDDVFISIAGEITAQQTFLVKKNPNDGHYDVSDHVPVVSTIHAHIPKDKNLIIKKWVLNKIKALSSHPIEKFEALINPLDLSNPNDQAIITEFYNLYALVRELQVTARISNQLGNKQDFSAALKEFEELIANYLLDPALFSQKYKFYHELKNNSVRMLDLFTNPPANFNPKRITDFLDLQNKRYSQHSSDSDIIFKTKQELGKKLNATVTALITRSETKNDKNTDNRIKELHNLFFTINVLLNKDDFDHVIITNIEAAIINYLDQEIIRKKVQTEFERKFNHYRKGKNITKQHELRVCFELTDKPYHLDTTGDQIRSLLCAVSNARSLLASSSNSNATITHALQTTYSSGSGSDSSHNSNYTIQLNKDFK